MKRCINCLAPCEDNAEKCNECGFDGTAQIKYEHSLPAGTRLAKRYILGGVYSRSNSFTSYYAFDVKSRSRVRVYEYLPSELMFRLPDEVVIKYNDVNSGVIGEKEINNFCAHFTKMCEISENTILDFTDCFAENSTMYYVCSAASGTPLSSLIGNGRKIPFSKAAELLSPVFDVIDKLERSGKWHGCLSPYSIITNENRITCISGYTYPPLGTSSPFDAPEKRQGTAKCGTHTDIYALGAILYEATTGYLPPSVSQRASGKPLRFPADMGEREKEIIQKALASDKNDRYATAEAFYADIQNLLNPTKAETKTKAKEKLPTREIIRRIVLAISLTTLVLSVAYLINYFFLEPYRAGQQANKLESLTRTTVADVDPWAEIRAQYPDIIFPEDMNPEYADLYAKNSHFAGRVSIPGIELNEFVVKYTDNDYYLRRDFDGNNANHGTPFFDYRNNVKNLNRNTIIYGHNMRYDDKVFGILEKYRDPETFKSAPLIMLDTIYGKYTFKIYAVFISNSKESDDNGHIFNYIFTEAGNSQFANYIAEVDKRKLYTTGVDINENDKILTLSTCCYDFEDARLVVVGRLLREGESAEIGNVSVVKNDNPKYPQAYYDAKRTGNPYKNDPDLFK